MAKRNRPLADVRDLLAGIPLFDGLHPDHLGRLANACRAADLPGHRVLYSAGQPLQDIHYLIAGTVKRFTLRADSIEKVLELVAAGQFVGLAESLTSDHHLSHAESLDACTILSIGRGSLRAVLAEDGGLANRLLDALARQQRAAEFAVIRHHSVPVTQRVLDFLLKLAGQDGQLAGETTVRLGASKRLVAASLDMAAETFSRTLRQLSDDGIIVVDGRCVHIQHAALAAVNVLPSKSPLQPVRYPRQERGAEPDVPAAVEIINLCGRHRMLSQRIASAWVLSQRKIDTPAARLGVRRFGQDFQRNLTRTSQLPLEWPVREHLGPLEAEWAGFRTLVEHAAGLEGHATRVFAVSERVLALADRLTTAAVQVAASADARRLEFAARNRMLCARIVKLWLFADWRVVEDDARRLIEVSAAEFEENLARLGEMVAGVPHGSAQVAVDAEEWRRFLAKVRGGRGKASGDEHVVGVTAAGESLFRQVDATVKLCERLALNAR